MTEQKKSRVECKMNNYSYLSDLLEEAEMYCIVHEIEIYLEDGYHIGWPYGCWTLCPEHWGLTRAREVAALFAHLFFMGCSPPMAADLAYAYIRQVREFGEKTKE